MGDDLARWLLLPDKQLRAGRRGGGERRGRSQRSEQDAGQHDGALRKPPPALRASTSRGRGAVIRARCCRARAARGGDALLDKRALEWDTLVW